MKNSSLIHGLKAAFIGIYTVFRTERNFKIHCLGLVINGFMMFFLQLKVWECSLILLCCAIVLCLELLNSAIERICDYIQPNFDIRIGKIKDISAGAVLCASIISVIVGVIIYFPYLYIFL